MASVAMSRARISASRNVAPCPTSLSTSTVPPWASTMVVAIEVVVEVFAGDAGARVDHFDDHATVPGGGAERDGAAGRRELEGVAEEVGEGLGESVAVDERGPDAAVEAADDGDVLVLGEHAMLLDGVVEDGADDHGLAVDREVAAFDADEIEEVLDEALHAFDSALGARGHRASP